MKKIQLVALLAMLLPNLVMAQFSLSGKISDNITKSPLRGASISVAGRTTQTDAYGNFILANLNGGSYTINVKYLGYTTVSKLLQLQADEVLNVSLERSAILTDEAIVTATRANSNSASTYTNLSREELEKNNLGQDLPYLLNQTPSVVVSSDAGTGIGYTGIRIRGSDPTRINVTLNGIPFNDSESQGSYFVDLPDLASSVDNIQIQRGVGTSTNGAGAFGASLNIQTTTLNDSAYLELDNSAGSYNSLKNTLKMGTGLMNGKFTFDGRLSRIKSDGYIDRASSNLKSYFLSGAFYGKNDLVRANIFSGTEKTYQAWNGVPEPMLETNRTFNSFTYDDQTDNYTQDHYQLLYTHNFSEKLSVNTALHYTHGSGYYEEFKDDQELSNYGISPVVTGTATISNSDLIRRRWLDNDFYGLTYALNFKPSTDFNFVLGGAYNEYDGAHFGEVTWAEYASDSKIRHRYYSGKGFKTDFNVFGRANYQIGSLNFFADLQYRALEYKLSGTDKNTNVIDKSANLNFFNPKIGLTYQLNPTNSLYASFSVANKEPNRDDYINSTSGATPRSENLKDLEAGYKVTLSNFSAGLNVYGMFYQDQLVLTGKINDVGEYIRQNVPDSYRLGVELDSKLRINRRLSWHATGSLSQNRVKDFTEYADDYDNGGQIVNNFHDTDLAFSPAFIGSSEISYSLFNTLDLAFLSKVMSRQYLDNTSNKSRALRSFDVHDIRLAYHISLRQLKQISLSLLVNNVFSEKYASNGYTFSYLYNNEFTTENYYFPQAYRNFLLALSVRF